MEYEKPVMDNDQSDSKFEFNMDSVQYFFEQIQKKQIKKEHLEVMLAVLMMHLHDLHFKKKGVTRDEIWFMMEDIMDGSGIQTVKQVNPIAWEVEFDQYVFTAADAAFHYTYFNQGGILLCLSMPLHLSSQFPKRKCLCLRTLVNSLLMSRKRADPSPKKSMS
jgi:hypothetical protein